MKISFLGATQTVTGSRYLITLGSQKILIDCGLYQGYKELRLRNWDQFPVAPHDIDAVLLTHAHIDHSGYLPALIKQGFRGKIYSTPGTKALCSILLPDSGHLQEEEARHANTYGFSKHKPARPLYTAEEGRSALKHFQTIDFETPLQLFKDFNFSFKHAGHIIGASSIRIRYHDCSILFTGDLGRPHDPVMRAPATIQATDYLIIESTYGDRLHESTDPTIQLGQVINSTLHRGGSVIIPTFAVGRAQSLLYHIDQLKKNHVIPPHIPVFLDSPMAIDATDIFCAYQHEHRLSTQQCHDLCATATYINTPDESKQLDAQKMPKIIISASGMATGGRVLHHIKAYAGDPNSTILFTGFQASGTRGARMLNGETEIKIHGQFFPIHAKVEKINGASAHADYQEILTWLEQLQQPPKKVFITHGEPAAARSLQEKIEKKFGWSCVVPNYLDEFNLT